MSNELMNELQVAVKSNPDLSVLEVLEYVMDNYAKYRDVVYCEKTPYKRLNMVHTRRTNSEILKALKRFNERK